MTDRRKPFIASGEFWLGVATTFICLALGMGLYTRFFG